MATVISGILTDEENLDIQVGKGLKNSQKKLSIGGYTSTGALADNTVILLHRIPVDAVISSMRFWATDQGTTGDINIGFYPGNIKASEVVIGDAVDEDAIGTAIDVNAAAISDVEIRFETKAITTHKQKAWELAGLSSRPDYEDFFVAGTLSEATTAAGSFLLHTTYTD